ncbi:MAG: polysaccharide deacetylase family protein [Deltaproteobacteria bacterium]|nr:polysaccharide deacetylase family protein [Deltaproteobacteria bacterium]
MDARALRWWIKKAARAWFALAAVAMRSVLPRGATSVRALTYHRFGDARRDPFCVSAEEFDRQMGWLAREKLAVSLDDLEAFLRGDRILPPDAVLVTVDDGNPCVLACAAPIAERHGIPLVSFVPAGELATDAAARAADVPSRDARLTTSEISELASHGIAIGSHALTHRSLARLPEETQRTEAERSRTVLESLTGRPVAAFAYPYGTRADYDERTAATLRGAGYRLAFTSQHGAITRGSDPLSLPRVKVEGGEGLWMFRAIVHGAMDGWRWVDRWLWRLQETP